MPESPVSPTNPSRPGLCGHQRQERSKEPTGVRVHAAGERIEVALTASYTLAEDRITGVAADGALQRSVFPLGSPAAYHLAVLEFYLAFPDTPERNAAPTWLAQYAPKQLPTPTT